MFSKLFTAGLFALFAQSALAATCARTYTVQEGDWCDTISANKNVSTYQLAVVNPQINTACTNLTPGESLCLGNTGEDCATTYTVQAGDSCGAIAASHGLNSTIFDMNNPNINEACDNIYIGEVLCVSSSVQVPPTPAGVIPASTIPPGATPAVPSSSTPAAPDVTTVLTTSTAAPAAATTPAAAATTPAPAAASSSAADDGDDDECEDDDEDTTSAAAPAVTSSAAAPATTTAAASVTITAVASATSSAADEDDSDLPFCDEL